MSPFNPNPLNIKPAMSSKHHDPALNHLNHLNHFNHILTSPAIPVLPTHPPLLSSPIPLTHLQQAESRFPFSTTTLPPSLTSMQQLQPSPNTISPATAPPHYDPISQSPPFLFETNHSPVQGNSISHPAFQNLISSIPTAVHVPTQNVTYRDLCPQSDNHSFPASTLALSASFVPNSYGHNPLEQYPPLDDHLIGPAPPPANPVAALPHGKALRSQTSKKSLRVKCNIRKSRSARMKNAHSLGSVRCQLCPELFENKVNAERHCRGSHPTTPHLFQCNYCTASYESKGARTIHVNKAHPEMMSNGRLMKSRSAVRRCSKMFQCLQENCGKIYSALSNLNRHFEMHHIKKRYPCPNCDYSATTRWNLKVHYSKKHEQKQNN